MKLSTIKNRQSKKILPFIKEVFPTQTLFLFLSHCISVIFGKQILVIKQKKKIFGIAIISSIIFFGIKCTYLNTLSVKKSEQGKGYGKKILYFLEKKAKAGRSIILFLFSHSSRKAAHKFYESQGFYKFANILFWKKIS